MSATNWRRFYPSHIELWELDQSSNETESDIPGHGRLLGKAYQAIGKRVESISSRIAARCGLGPNAVAIRISRRASQAQRSAWDLWGIMHANGRILYDAKEEELQKKDVKRLVRYTKSKTELTRKQALEHIIDSTIKYEHLSSFLEACKAAQFIEKQEPFIWDYFDTSLQISSRLAISFLQEKKLRKFIKDVKTRSLDNATETLNLILQVCLSFLIMSNSAKNFERIDILLWLLAGVARRNSEEKVNWFLKQVVPTLKGTTEPVEWSEFDELFELWFRNNYSAGEGYCRNRNMATFWDMISLKEKLPGTFQSTHYNIWQSTLKYPRETKPRLEGPSTVWKKLRYSHQFLGGVLASPSSKGVKWMGRHLGMPFLNDADEIFSRIAYKWSRRDDKISLDSAYVSSCKELASLVDSADAELKSRAILCIKPVLCHDQYSSKMILDALAHTTFFGTAEYDEIVLPIRSRMIAMRTAEEYYVKRVYRHCNKQGYLLHLLNKCPEEVVQCQGTCAFEDVLLLDFEDLIFISSLPESASTWAELSPNLIYVGTFPNGQDAYLAVGSLSDKAFCLTDNGLPGPLRYAYISAIRYPFDTFDASRFLDAQAGGECGDNSSCMDPTGPYSWKFVRYLSGIYNFIDEDGTLELDNNALPDGEHVGGNHGTMWPFDEVEYEWEESSWFCITTD